MHENVYFAKITNSDCLDLNIMFSLTDAVMILTDTGCAYSVLLLPQKWFKPLFWLHIS